MGYVFLDVIRNEVIFILLMYLITLVRDVACLKVIFAEVRRATFTTQKYLP
jgi:hypothetical protein